MNFTKLIAGAFICMSLAACKKDKGENAVLRKLYKTYKDGQIEMCKHKGSTVYSAMHNVEDGATTVFDESGNPIGVCNYAWGPVDSICGELENCETVYNAANNMWGKPATDKFGLGK